MSEARTGETDRETVREVETDRFRKREKDNGRGAETEAHREFVERQGKRDRQQQSWRWKKANR